MTCKFLLPILLPIFSSFFPSFFLFFSPFFFPFFFLLFFLFFFPFLFICPVLLSFLKLRLVSTPKKKEKRNEKRGRQVAVRPHLPRYLLGGRIEIPPGFGQRGRERTAVYLDIGWADQKELVGYSLRPHRLHTLQSPRLIQFVDRVVQALPQFGALGNFAQATTPASQQQKGHMAIIDSPRPQIWTILVMTLAEQGQQRDQTGVEFRRHYQGMVLGVSGDSLQHR